jgi:hypothetical protein
VVEGKLFAFGIAAAELRAGHIGWLDEYVVPILSSGGSVTLAGEASRTGSAGRNLGLSIRRAQSVLDHLRRRARGPVSSRQEVFEVSAIGGEGETAAAAAGLEDGSEAAFYRAVRVKAWGKPVPPDISETMSDVPQSVRRVIVRRWLNASHSEPRGGDPREDEERFSKMIDFFRQVHDTVEEGGSDQRVYHEYPPDYVVVAVHDDFTFDESSSALAIKARTKDHIIRYEWGLPSSTVVLFKTQTIIFEGGRRSVETSSTAYPRSEIWKHTTSPNAKVFGR